MISKLLPLNYITCSLDIYLWNPRRNECLFFIRPGLISWYHNSWGKGEAAYWGFCIYRRYRRFCILLHTRPGQRCRFWYRAFWSVAMMIDWLMKIPISSQYHGKLYTLGHLDSVSDFFSFFNRHDLVTCRCGMFIMWHYPRPHHHRAVDSSIWNLATLKDFASQYSGSGTSI